jgi:exonuclease SbcC
LSKATQELERAEVTRTRLENAREEMLKAERTLSEAQRKYQGVQARHQAAEQARADADAAQKVVKENQAGHAAFLAAQEEKTKLDTRVRAWQQVESQRAGVDKNVALYDAEVRAKQKELEGVTEAEKVVIELQGAVIEQTRLEGELEKARQQQARLDDAKRVVAQQEEQLKRQQARRTDLDRQLGEAKEIEQQIAVTTKQSDARRKEVESGRETLARFKSEADLVKEQSQRLEELQTALCPLCEQPLTESHRAEMLARNNKRLEEMRLGYREESKKVQSLETILQQEQSSLQTWQAALLKLPRADEAQKLNEEIERTQAQLEQGKGQLASLADAAQQMEATSKALAALGDPRRRYDVANEQANRRKGLEADLAQARQAGAAAKDQLAKLLEELAEFGDLDAQQDQVAAILQAHRAAYQAVLTNQRQAEALAMRVQEVATLAEELAELKSASEELERAHKAALANFDADAYDHACTCAQELQNEVGTLSGQLTTLKDSQEKAERERADLRALTASVAEAEAKMARLKDEEDVLEMIRAKLRQAGPYISAALNRQISDGARQIFCELMQDYSRMLTWKDDYSISLEVDGRERNFSQLSGGEQMSAALSVRLALLREMSSIDIAFFDEPTSNLDEARREALARQIINVRGFRQLFVISHDDTFEQATQNLIRVERVDGTSRILVG